MNFRNITGGQYGTANHEILPCSGKGGKYDLCGRVAPRYPAYTFQTVKGA